jgi:L-seryl-tRNA selenium transferase/Selenocysteine synthase N terminal
MFQKLPSTDELLRQPNMQALVEREGHSAVAESIRVVLGHLRQEIAGGRISDGQIAGAQLNEKSLDLALGGLSAAVERQLRQSLSYSLRPLVNATGVILHTNLGRAPLAPSALDHVRATASAYSNLEFDLATGERGKRDVHVDRLFQKLLGDAHVGTDAFVRPTDGTPGPPTGLHALQSPTTSISEESSRSSGRLQMRASHKLSNETPPNTATQPGQPSQRQNKPVSVAPTLPPR